MARLSDIIEKFIKELINESNDEQIQIQRNELADQFRCAPSQINYVLTTRFTHENGYAIESRRGGGGYIIIKQVAYNSSNGSSKVIYDSIGDSITYHSSLAILQRLYEVGLATGRELELMKMAINDRTLIRTEERNKVRADILKGMIVGILL